MRRAVSSSVLAAAALMMAPGIASAYQVHVSITGAGTVDEDPALSTQANMINPACSSPQTTATGTVGADCFPGDPNGDYAFGWTVRWLATPAPGWSFVRWESDGSSGSPVICDGSGGSSTHTGQSCQFATFDNLQTRAVFADTTAPTASITGGPAAASTSGRDVSFSFTVTGQPAGQPVSYRCKLTGPGGVVQDWTSCASLNKSYSGLVDGGHTFEVEAKDPSGNFTTASRTWSVDAIQPETVLTTDGPSQNSTVASSTASFQWTGSPDVQKYLCQVNSGAVVDPCTSPHPTGSLSDGHYTFSVWAQDTHGNVESSPATRTWTIDTTPPDTQIDSGPSGPTTNASPTFTFSSEPSASFQCRLDSNQEADWQLCNSPRPYSGLEDGPHTFEVRARDGVLNTDQTPDSRTFNVDTTAPDGDGDGVPDATDQCPTISGPPPTGCPPPPPVLRDILPPETTITKGPKSKLKTKKKNVKVKFEFSANETGSTFQCRLDKKPPAPCSSPTTVKAKIGKHTFEVVATDVAGNADSTPATSKFKVKRKK